MSSIYIQNIKLNSLCILIFLKKQQLWIFYKFETDVSL